ncbi:MAG: AI-2E family transporter [Rickettsiales bacterium]|jgi:predicted PurR-regulated permease PerM|nr:AI-2E family transporter [Rickettsiales bacterium]
MAKEKTPICASNAALNVVLVCAIISILRAGQNLFLPFVIALFIWALIWLLDSAFDNMFARLRASGLARWLSRPLSIITIIGIFYFIIAGIRGNMDGIAEGFARYQSNLPAIMDRLGAHFGIDMSKYADVSALVRGIDVPRLINKSLQGFAALLSSMTMIVVYLVFMLMEEQSIKRKFPLAFKNSARVREARQIVGKILAKIKAYLFTKTLTSIATGAVSYAIMKSVGLDFALFWAILMFLCNYIPTLGSIVSSVFPIALSLIQFENTLVPFAVCAVGITALQFLIGSIVEPRIMGKQINISPLVLITSLVAWGYIWGVMGMFLCVPIMIILTIVLYNIPSTKRIAILMSEDGESV